jgi:2-polyprenyl-3-methyl-5-hydroxy-6-metoxy-1,4-benzoquinol methylase
MIFHPLETIDLDVKCEYRGVREMAAPNTHAMALRTLSGSKNGRVLDMPCGAGAMTLRLLEADFSDVTSADINEDAFSVPSSKFVRTDLRERAPFEDGSFDSILCIECIEHLENPFHLIRELSRLLAPGGEVVITTPNVMSTNARSKFFSVGYLPHFDDLACRWERQKQLGFQAHIMPVPLNWLMYMADLNGLELTDLGANRYARRPKLKDRFVAKMVRLASRRFFPPELYSVLTHDVVMYGDILVARFVKRR